MAGSIPDLIAKLVLDSSGFNSGINEASKSAGGFSSGIGKAVGGVVDFGKNMLKVGTIAAGAMTAGGVALASFAEQGAKLENIETSFNAIAEASGKSGDAILASFKDMTGGMITNTDAMKSYNMAAQLVSDDFANTLPNSMNYLTKVSAATGQDLDYLMDSYVRGIGRLSPMILDNLGIQVDLTQAYQDYADANGLVAGELTKTEQQMALNAQVQKKLMENTAELPDITDTAAGSIASLKASMTDIKDEIMKSLGSAFAPLFSVLADLAKDVLPKLLEGLQPIIESFGNFMTLLAGGDFEGAGEEMGTLLATITGKISEMLPGIIEAGIQIVSGLIMGISQSLPTLIPTIIEMMLGIVNAIVENLPILIDAGISLIEGIVEGLIIGISESLPTLIPTVIEMMLGIVDAIVENLPILIDAGISLIEGIVEGLINALPIIIEKGPVIIENLFTAIIEALPKILELGVSIIESLVTGITDNLPTLITSAVNLVRTIANTILSNLPTIISAAIDIVKAIVSGIIKAIPILVGCVPQLIKSLANGFKSAASTIWNIGKDIINGIWEGIKRSWDTIKENILGLFSGLWDGVKDFFGIGSPSKLFMELGRQLNQGFALGIKASVDLPEKELAYSIPAVGGASSPYSNYNDATNEYIISLLKTLPDTIGKSMRDNILLAGTQ